MPHPSAALALRCLSDPARCSSLQRTAQCLSAEAAALLAVVVSWVDSMKGVASDPLSRAFPSISNDKSGNRAFPKGLTEVNARTIKPKVKDFDKNLRFTVPGKNIFGAPSSKMGGGQVR